MTKRFQSRDKMVQRHNEAIPALRRGSSRVATGHFERRDMATSRTTRPQGFLPRLRARRISAAVGAAGSVDGGAGGREGKKPLGDFLPASRPALSLAATDLKVRWIGRAKLWTRFGLRFGNLNIAQRAAPPSNGG